MPPHMVTLFFVTSPRDEQQARFPSLAGFATMCSDTTGGEGYVCQFKDKHCRDFEANWAEIMRSTHPVWLYDLSEAIMWQAAEDGAAIAAGKFSKFKEKTPTTLEEEERIVEDYLDWIYTPMFGRLMEVCEFPWEGSVTRAKIEAAISGR